MNLKVEGYSVFIVKCADNSYYSGMCKNLNRRVIEINNRLISYFVSRPKLVPVIVVFHEDHIPFREAYVKHRYLRKLTKRYRDHLINTGRWPLGRNLKNVIANK